jgi:hypothetical protein
MKQWIGTTLLTLLALLFAALGISKGWPWWLWVILTIAALACAVLAFPVQANEKTTFAVGDFSGSSFVNVYSDAQEFIHGEAKRALFFNIIHRPSKKKSK